MSVYLGQERAAPYINFGARMYRFTILSFSLSVSLPLCLFVWVCDRRHSIVLWLLCCDRNRQQRYVAVWSVLAIAAPPGEFLPTVNRKSVLHRSFRASSIVPTTFTMRRHCSCHAQLFSP